LRFAVTLVGRITVTGDGVASDSRSKVIETVLDSVMDELDHLGAIDPRIDLDLTVDEVSFSVTIDSSNPIGALSQASGLLRTAIHRFVRWHGPISCPAPGGMWAIRLVSVRSDPVPATGGVPHEAGLVGV